MAGAAGISGVALRRKRGPIVLLLLLWVWIGGCASAYHLAGIEPPPPAPRDPYVDGLVARALALELDRAPQWLRLGHYRPGMYAGGLTSENDNPRFFLSPDGKANPRAELVETIRGFFRPAMQEPGEDEAGPPQHPICRFPARFAYLSRALQIDAARLPQQSCPRFMKLVREMNPRSVSLVFSSYYLNNPSSAFGHTFLRFNHAQTMAVGERRELLDQAVGFAATVDTDNAIFYAIKGLTGLFPGELTRLPYYYKVREYNDYENRDLWSYELNMTPQERYMLVAHVWEVGATHFDYFFLDENCSYRLNRILEAAMPERDLTSRLHIPVLPADTIKAIVESPGLVRSIDYRPSLRTQFRHATAQLPEADLQAIEVLVQNVGAPLPAGWSVERKAVVLDAAADLFDIKHIKEIIKGKDGAAAEFKRRLLSRRAALGIATGAPDPDPGKYDTPHLVHETHRGGVGGGSRGNDAPFVNFDFRLAAHDLADPSASYPELSQLEFMPMRLRMFPEKRRLRLAVEDFALVRIVSLHSVDRFDMGISWHIAVGGRTLEELDCDHCLAATVRGGSGFAHTFGDATTLFFLVDGSLAVADAPIGIADGGVRAGFGPVLGTRVRFDRNLILVASGELLYHPAQPKALWPRAHGVLRWAYLDNQALSLEGSVARDTFEAQLMALTYF